MCIGVQGLVGIDLRDPSQDLEVASFAKVPRQGVQCKLECSCFNDRRQRRSPF